LVKVFEPLHWLGRGVARALSERGVGDVEKTEHLRKRAANPENTTSEKKSQEEGD